MVGKEDHMSRTVSVLTISILMVGSAVADPCSPDDARMQNCIRTTITSDKVIMGGWYSNADKMKERATEWCSFDCGKDRTDFQKKWDVPATSQN